MKLSDLFEEASAGSTSAHSVAGSRSSLFRGGVLTPSIMKRKLPKMGFVQKIEFNTRKKVAGVEVMNFNNEA